MRQDECAGAWQWTIACWYLLVRGFFVGILEVLRRAVIQEEIRNVGTARTARTDRQNRGMAMYTLRC